MTQVSRRWIFLASVLSILLLLILYFFFFPKNEETVAYEDLQKKISVIDAQLDQDFINILMSARPEDSVTFETITRINSEYPYFLLNDENEVLYWSDFSFSLDFELLDKTEPYQLAEDPFGTFLLRSRQITRNEKQYWLIHAVRLIYPGSVRNDYLITGTNPEIFGNEEFELFGDPEEGNFIITNGKGDPIFSVDFLFGYQPAGRFSNTPVLLFFFSVLLLYTILSYDFIAKVWKSGKQWRAISYTFLTIFVFRFIMLLLDFPEAFFRIELFDPIYYASSWLNPSLGDLWINSICFALIFSMILLKITTHDMHERMRMFNSRNEQIIILLICLAISSTFLYLLWDVPADILLNSQWALDIQNFPAMDWFQFISYLILFLWGALYVLITIALCSLLASMSRDWIQFVKWVGIIGFPVLGVLLFFQFWAAMAWVVHLIFFTIIFRYQLYKNVFKLGLDTFYTFFFAAIITSVVCGLSTRNTKQDQLLESKDRFTDQNLIENDVITEYFLDEVMQRIKGDLFIQNRLADPLLAKEPIETKIRKIYLDNYFDQFEVVISIYSSSGRKISGPASTGSLSGVRNRVVKSDYATDVRGLFFIRGDSPLKGNQFISFVPVTKDGNAVGTILLELQKMNIQPSSVYPKLLLDENFTEKLEPTQYNYGIFVEKELVSSVGNFNYSSDRFLPVLDNPNLVNEGVAEGRFHHLGIKDGARLIVISSPSISPAEFAGNISLYFVIFVSLTFISILINSLIKGYKNFVFNYSTKLQLYLNFAFFFPILIISIITLGLLANSYREDLDRQYLQKAELIRGNLTSTISSLGMDGSTQNSIDEELTYLANTTGSELNLYSSEGELFSTNRPNIFEKRILSKFINPAAIAAIRENNLNQFLTDESIGNLNYKSVYLPILTGPRQELIGILAVPFFESEAELNKLVADVLSNIFNAFVVIFIVFLIISYFVSKNLTFPFKLLTQKLKTTNLENNEPMIWNARDEIGMLVNEYNNMLFKLEQSKKVLASTEKESAWKEMAKQVAHEIKNPLTPMKLTLQHLMRLDWQGQEDEKERLKKSLNTLIHQVDALSGIASSFSTFAKMPLPKNELMNFKTVVTKVLELYSNDDRVDLRFKDDSYTDEIPIMGDDKLFGRVITNLIINGIQSVEEGIVPLIKVWLWLSDSAVFLEISDNGKGIPLELREKIFIPNFSTKTQGSGLGLAIAKSGVETAGGKIWFETETEKGTTFYLTFPIVQ